MSNRAPAWVEGCTLLRTAADGRIATYGNSSVCGSGGAEQASHGSADDCGRRSMPFIDNSTISGNTALAPVAGHPTKRNGKDNHCEATDQIGNVQLKGSVVSGRFTIERWQFLDF